MPGNEVIGKEEFEEIQDIFQNGSVLFRSGFDNLRNNRYKVKRFENDFASLMSVENALAVSSGTAALRVALAALDISEGDEVITQSFTFVATVEAIVESRATPVICNINKSLNMDPDNLKDLINPRTKAVIAVHMLGVPANIKEIKKICDNNNIFLIEDTAWGCGGSVNNKKLGTFGDIGTYSFDFAKTITTGEGGMLVFKDKKVFEKASAWHDHGHENNPSVPRWADTRQSSGFNFRMTELQGAVGIAQLKKLSHVIENQRLNKFLIKNELEKIDDISFRDIPNGSYETADALIFFLDSKERAINCREELLKQGLGTKILPEAYTWHFAATWTHIKEIFQENPKLADDLNPSKDILSKAVSVPIGVNMNKNVPQYIKNAVLKTIH